MADEGSKLRRDFDFSKTFRGGKYKEELNEKTRYMEMEMRER